MIQMRWIITNYEKRKLQYRQKIDTTIRAGMWSNMKIIETADYQWTDWADVPEVFEPPTYMSPSNKCSQCGIEYSGPMGYVCTNTSCPTGLGGSMS